MLAFRAISRSVRRNMAATEAILSAAARSYAVAAGAGAKAGTRTESDTMGKIEVSNAVYWGAQTQRSLENFKIGGRQARMPTEIIQCTYIELYTVLVHSTSGTILSGFG